MKAVFAAALIAFVLASSGAAAEGRTDAEIAADPALAFVAQIEPYKPKERVKGTISIWGHGSFKRDMVGKLVNAWIAAFQRVQPDVRFENKMYGTASAIGALYSGAGNLAILGEEISPAAARAFERARGYAPTGFEIATGSLDVNYYDFAHMIFVHKDNPIQQLSLPQLRAIFAADPGQGLKRNRVWGDLGLGGEWADKPIQPYGWKTNVDFSLFFRERVLDNDHRFNSAIREFAHVARPDGSQYDQGEQILDALAADRYGIAISNVRFANSDVRPLALAWTPGGRHVEANEATLILQAYPLVRIIPAFIDRPPGQPIDPALREFLRFILSREGQLGLLRNSGYLPLGPEQRRRELARLK